MQTAPARLKITPASPKLDPLYETGWRYKVFHGGRAGAKSWGMAQAAIYYMYTYKVMVMSCRMHLNSIKDSNHRLLTETIEAMGLIDYFNITKTEIHCIRTGSSCIFRGLAENLTSIKSTEGIDICIVDEAEAITDDAWDVLIPTIRKPGSEIWISFNPRMVSDPTYRRFVMFPPPTAVVRQITYLDNPYVSKTTLEDIEYCRQTDPERYQWVYMGVPLGEGDNALLTTAQVMASRARAPKAQTQLAIIAGIDVSTLGKDWSVIVRRQGDTILSIDKFHVGDTTQVRDWVKSIYLEKGWDKCVIDANGNSGVYDMISEWSTAEGGPRFECVGFWGGKTAISNLQYTNRRTEVYFLLRRWVINDGKLPDDKAFDTLTRIEWVPTQGEQRKLKPKEEIGKSPDECDALSMTFAVDDLKPVTEDQYRDEYYDNYGYYAG